MNTNQGLLHWSNLLYALIVIASLSITQGSGNTSPPAWLDPAMGMVLAQVGLILLPTLLFVWLTRQPLTKILKLRRLNLGSGVKCFLIGLTCWPIFVFLGNLTQFLIAWVNPVQTSGSVNIASQGGSAWILLVGVTLVAPLCEEMLCRGVLLSAYEQRFASHAIWLVGILFAFLHPSLDQVLGAFFVGAVAGWVVYHTRSIWAGVLVHIGANLLSALLMLLTTLAAPGAFEGAAQVGDLASLLWIGMLVWGGIGLVMLAPWFFLLRSISKGYLAPTQPETRFNLSALWSFAVVVTGVVTSSVYRLFQGVL